MAQGRLGSNARPEVAIEIAGVAIWAIIDTGFEGGLQLPETWLPVLNPPIGRREWFQYPNGDIEELTTYTVGITFDGMVYECPAIFLPNEEFLLGLEALRDYCLTIDFPAGRVQLDRVTGP